MTPLRITVLGLSLTSSWGNGHATTYRGLLRALAERGHEIMFLECDLPWYASARDLPNPPFADTRLYSSIDELIGTYRETVRTADLVIVGSYVPGGIDVGNWVLETAQGVTAFYDIDTPVTLAKLARSECEYLSQEQIPQYDCYLSFAGGHALTVLEREFGSPCARALYCSVDPAQYYPMDVPHNWDLGYLGTYSDDRQPKLESLLLDPARRLPDKRFIVAGPQYPDSVQWPENVERIEHLPPAEHCRFYNSQRFTLNVTRADMVRAGHSPSVRLFEAAACGIPIISDWWTGLDEFFTPNEEILISYSADDTVRHLNELDDNSRRQIGEAAMQRVLADHTAERRAEELEAIVEEASRLRTLRANVGTTSRAISRDIVFSAFGQQTQGE